MKILSNVAFVIIFLILASCRESVPGPQGPAGQDGQQAFVFEYVDLTFSASNQYELLLEIPEDFQMLDSDVVLVYFLYDFFEEEDLDLWRALPQTQFTDFGTLIYNYDFTLFDVNVFMDANFDLNLLGASFTDNWIARVLVVPGQFTNGRTINTVDYSDYNAVVEHYNIGEQDVITVKQ